MRLAATLTLLTPLLKIVAGQNPACDQIRNPDGKLTGLSFNVGDPNAAASAGLDPDIYYPAQMNFLNSTSDFHAQWSLVVTESERTLLQVLVYILFTNTTHDRCDLTVIKTDPDFAPVSNGTMDGRAYEDGTVELSNSNTKTTISNHDPSTTQPAPPMGTTVAPIDKTTFIAVISTIAILTIVIIVAAIYYEDRKKEEITQAFAMENTAGGDNEENVPATLTTRTRRKPQGGGESIARAGEANTLDTPLLPQNDHEEANPHFTESQQRIATAHTRRANTDRVDTESNNPKPPPSPTNR